METLFLRCPIVVSAPGVFFWAGEHTVLDGSVAVIQQMPLRVYVGLEFYRPAVRHHPFLTLDSGEPDVTGDVPSNVYRLGTSAMPCRFRAAEREANIRKVIEVANLIFTDLRAAVSDAPIPGHFRIRTASELRPGSGVNWSGAFSVALITAMLLVVNGKFRKFAQASGTNGALRWETDCLAELVGLRDSWFTQINRWAWILEATFHEGAGSGYGTLGAMAPTMLPVAYRREVSTRFGGQGPRSVIAADERFDPMQASELYSRLKGLLGPYAKAPLGYEAFAFRDACLGRNIDESSVEWPIHYGIVDTWCAKPTGRMIRVASQDRDRALFQALDKLESTKANPFGASAHSDKRRFGFQRCVGSGSRTREAAALSSRCTHYTLGGDSAIVCNLMRDVLGNQDPAAAKTLVNSLASVHGGLQQLGLAWPAADIVQGELGKLATKANLSAAAKLSGGGGGGCLLFAIAGPGSDGAVAEFASALRRCRYRVPELDTDVSPSIIWDSVAPTVQTGDDRPVPGVCVEVFDCGREYWGRSIQIIPDGHAFLLPANSGPVKEKARLAAVLQRDFIVVADFHGAWHLLRNDHREAGLKRLFEADLRNRAIRMLGEYLVGLSRKPLVEIASGTIALSEAEVKQLIKGYSQNVASLGKAANALLKDAASLHASGVKFPRLIVSRTGPRGVALWELTQP